MKLEPIHSEVDAVSQMGKKVEPRIMETTVGDDEGPSNPEDLKIAGLCESFRCSQECLPDGGQVPG